MSKKMKFALAIAVVTTAMIGVASPAFADDGVDPNKVGQEAVTALALGVHTLYLQTGSASIGKLHPLDTIFASGTLADSRSANIHPSGGSTAPLTTGYHTTDSVGNISASLTGTSYGEWLGASPVDASQITLTDSWSVASIGGVSVGYPAGIGITTGSDSASWTTAASHNWKLTHSFNGITFTGALISETEDSSTTASFGTQAFLVNN